MNLRSISRPSPARSQGSASRILGQEGRLQGREGSAFRPKVIDGVVHVAGRAAEPIQLDGNQFVGERRVPALPLRSGTSRRVAPRADGVDIRARERTRMGSAWEAEGGQEQPRRRDAKPAGLPLERPWEGTGSAGLLQQVPCHDCCEPRAATFMTQSPPRSDDRTPTRGGDRGLLARHSSCPTGLVCLADPHHSVGWLGRGRGV